MKKIPTIFDRDWGGDRSRVVNQPNPDCGWVFAGEGVATRKMDGTCCAVIDGQFVKRRELKQGASEPDNFILVDKDETTGKSVGWVPVSDGPEDRWYREAWDQRPPLWDGETMELVGPKIQGNPEGYDTHRLIVHDHKALVFDDQPPRTFEGLRSWMDGKDIEGIVFHHQDGRMGKIKLRDFGLKRKEFK